jgi:hypothetical protein
MLKDDVEVLEWIFMGEKNQITFGYSPTMPAECLLEQPPEGCPTSANIPLDLSSPSKHSYIGMLEWGLNDWTSSERRVNTYSLMI